MALGEKKNADSIGVAAVVVGDGTVEPQRVQKLKKQDFAKKIGVPNPKNSYLCSLIADNN